MTFKLGNWFTLGIAVLMPVCIMCSGCFQALNKPLGSDQPPPVHISEPTPPILSADASVPGSKWTASGILHADESIQGDFSLPAGHGGGHPQQAGEKAKKRSTTKPMPPPQFNGRSFTQQECRRLTLTNNPDLQVEVWEQVARQSLAGASALKMYPHPGLAAEATNVGTVLYPFENAQDLGFAAPFKRAAWRYYVEARWSPTDALQAYYISRNEYNDATKAGYQRVRAAQKLVGAVDAAYYRLLSMQECLPLAERLYNVRSGVSRQVKELRQDRLAEAEDYLRIEEKTSAARFRLTRIRTELERQKILLSGLMGFQANPCPQGFVVTGALSVPTCVTNTAALEAKALQSRPEAVMEGLNRINSENDLKRTTIKYFPKASTFYRYGRDDGYKRRSKQINEFGVVLYLDLLDWLTTAKEAEGLNAKAVKAEQRMTAVALAITTEVRMAALRCLEAQEEVQNAVGSFERAEKQLRIARGKVKVGVLESVAVEDAQGNMLQEEIDRIRAVGEANARMCELNCAMGTNYTEGVPCR